MWQNSGGHYASIVSGTTEAGFGYAIQPGGTPYWVGVYGSPALGDETGETEDQIAKVLADEQRKEEEKNAAQKRPKDVAATGNADAPANPAGSNPPSDLP